MLPPPPMSRHFFRLLFALTFTSLTCLAADGDLDPSFGGDGIIMTALAGRSEGFAMVIQPDQKIIVVGRASQNGSENDVLICRFLTNGSLDTSFGGGDGIVTTDLGTTGDRGSHVILQPDGQILVSGARASIANNIVTSDWALLRYQSNGTLDSSFGTGGIVFMDFGGADFGGPLALMADGRIVMTGYANNSAGIGRFTSAGVPDNTFSSDGKVLTTLGSGDGPAMILLPDGRIIIGGTRSTTDVDAALTRYLVDGTLDTSFGTQGITTTHIGNRYDSISQLLRLPDGQIIAAGRTQVGTSEEHIFLTRYTSDGALDSNFGVSGISTVNLGTGQCYVSGLVLGAEGRLLMAAESRSGNLGSFSLVKIDTLGTLDRNLAGVGYVNHRVGSSNEGPSGIGLQSDGKIVMAGYARSPGDYQVSAVRLLQDSAPEIGVFVGNGEVQNAGSHSAGAVKVGSEISIPYRVQNDGLVTLTGLSHTLSGPDAADFILPTLPTSLSPETSTQGLQIIFRPRETAASSRQATLTISSNDGNENPFVVSLLGTAGTPPTFTLHPQSQLIPTTPGATLTSAATGLGTITYQWQRNGSPIANSTISSYRPWFELYRSGIYTVVASNSFGSTASEPAYVGVVQRDFHNAVSRGYLGRDFTIAAFAEVPNGATLTYRWQRAGIDLEDGAAFSGVTQRQLTFLSPLLTNSGNYTCRVTMAIPGGAAFTAESTTTRVVVEDVPSVWEQTPPLMTRLNVPLNQQLQTSGAPTSFTLTGLPPGMFFNSTNGFFSGTPTIAPGTPLPHVFELNVVAISPAGSSLPKRLELTVLPALDAGTYYGMLEPTDVGKRMIGGLLSFTVTSSGMMSGSVSSHGIVRRFSSLTSAVAVTGIPIPRVAGEDQRHLYLYPGPDSGVLQPGSLAARPDGLSVDDETLTFFRQQHGSKVGSQTGRYRGTYNALFDTQQDDSPDAPSGFGFMQASISPAGMCSWTGRLADTSTIIGSTGILGTPGDNNIEHGIPFWSGLYGNKGAISGYLTTQPAPPNLAEPIQLGTQVSWLKPSTARDRYYPNGFQFGLSIVAAQYKAHSATLNPLGLPRNGTTAAATLVLSGPNVPATAPLSLGFGPAGQFLPKAPSTFRFTNVGAGGFFTGDVTFRDPNPLSPRQILTRTSVFLGLFVPGHGIGGGFFSLAQLPAAGPPRTTLYTSPIDSGRIMITPITTAE